MEKGANPDAFVFDLYGTLWDAVETYAMGFNEYFEQNNIQKRFTKNDLQSFMRLEQSKYKSKYPFYFYEIWIWRM